MTSELAVESGWNDPVAVRLTVRMVEGVGVARFEPAAGRSTAGARIVLVRRGEETSSPTERHGCSRATSCW